MNSDSFNRVQKNYFFEFEFELAKQSSFSSSGQVNAKRKLR